jgi:hypothetical protein
MSDLKAQLKEQLAQMEWNSLIPHAQRDALIVVNKDLDLVEVGFAIANDNTTVVQNWISEQLIQKPSSHQLSSWNNDLSKKFQTIIVQPFVLVSPVKNN